MMKGNIYKKMLLLLTVGATILVMYQIFNPVIGVDSKIVFDKAGEILTKSFGIG